MSDDAELLRRYAEDGVDQAFAEFVRRHLGLVYGAALRRLGGDGHAAADVAQQVFIAAARHGRKLAAHPGIAGWLYATTRNAALDHMRNEQRRREREAAAQVERDVLSGGTAQTLAAASDWSTVRPVLEEVLEELDVTDREAVLWRFFAGRSFAEVGRHLQLTENAARMRVERALDKLHALLARRGISSSAAALGAALASEATAAAVPASLAAAVTSSALASVAAAGAVAPAAGIFAMMNTTKIAVGAAVAMGLAAMGGSLYQNQQLRDARASIANANVERERAHRALNVMAARLREAEESIAAKEERIATLQAEPAASAQRPAGSQPISGIRSSAAASASNAGAQNVGFERMANPEYARLATQKLKAEIGLRYAPFYRMRNLTPEQIAKFEANRVGREQATMDVWSTAVAQGLSVQDPAVVKLVSEAAQPFDVELTQMLGRDRFQELTQFGSARSALDFVSSLAGNLHYTEAPLSRVQGEELVKVAVETTRRKPSPTNPKVMVYETDWTALETAAHGTLAAPQRAVLRAMIEARNLSREMAGWAPPSPSGTSGSAASPKG